MDQASTAFAALFEDAAEIRILSLDEMAELTGALPDQLALSVAFNSVRVAVKRWGKPSQRAANLNALACAALLLGRMLEREGHPDFMA